MIEEQFNAGKRLEIDEISLDSHTEKGRLTYGKFGNLKDGKEKLRLDKWYTQWGLIENEAYPDKSVEDDFLQKPEATGSKTEVFT